eukprot:GILI01015193.1.p1 GENE.GILI01015193.1~~GILI01015193.1.p1  ORF type:complete len:285 (+),score=88.63 GILI01015193.1:43-855(+)
MSDHEDKELHNEETAEDVEAESSNDENESDEEDEDEVLDENKESRLAKKTYWDSVYARELENFEDQGDYGEVWFGLKSVRSMIAWICAREDIQKDANIIDVGCGNGVFLLELAKKGFKSISGLDYSENAVQLATSVLQKENQDFIRVFVADMLRLELPPLDGSDSTAPLYDVVCDKGTFDPINLMKNESLLPYGGPDVSPCALYKASLAKLLKKQGYYVITSCNHTRQELESFFAPEFTVIDQVPYPVISFGGGQGSTITTVVMRHSDAV